MNVAQHDEVRLLLAHYRELDHATRQRIDEHVRHCTSCRTAFAAYERQDVTLRSLPVRAPGRGLRQEVFAKTIYREQKPRQLRHFWEEMVFTAVVTMAVIVFVILIRGQNLPPETAAGTATPAGTPLAAAETPTPQPAAAQTTVPLATPLTQTVTLPEPAVTPLAGPALPWMVYSQDQAQSTTTYLARADGSNAQVINRSAKALPAAPQLSPDGQWVAYGLDSLWLLPLNGTPAINVVAAGELKGTLLSLAWSRDSTALAFVVARPDGSHAVITLRLVDGLPLQVYPYAQGFPHLLGWDAAAQVVYILLSARSDDTNNGQIQALRDGAAPQRQPYSYAAGPTWRLHAPRIGPQGRWVYYLADRPGGGSLLVRQSLLDGSQSIAMSATLPVLDYVLSDGGDYVVYTLENPALAASGTEILMLSFAEGKPTSLPSLPAANAVPLSWSPVAADARQSWVLFYEPPVDVSSPAAYVLVRPADQVSVTLSLAATPDGTPALRFGGWLQTRPSAAAAVDGSNFDAVVAALQAALQDHNWPAIYPWLSTRDWRLCAYGAPCAGAQTSGFAALAALMDELRGATLRVEPNHATVNPPGFTPLGEATLLVRRRLDDGSSDSTHLYLRREDGQWRLSGALTGIPYYDSPSLAEVRAAPGAFSGRQVVIEGTYQAAQVPGDLPVDAPRLGTWVLTDASGASLWVRNAAGVVVPDVAPGAAVQVFGRLKVEQGWPFVEADDIQVIVTGHTS